MSMKNGVDCNIGNVMKVYNHAACMERIYVVPVNDIYHSPTKEI